MDLFWNSVAAVLTFAIFSFLYKDNPFESFDRAPIFVSLEYPRPHKRLEFEVALESNMRNAKMSKVHQTS